MAVQSMADESLFGTSWVGRLSYIGVIIIVFYIVLRLGLIILTHVYEKPTSPHIIDGMIDASELQSAFIQDPTNAGSKPIYKSDNESKGMEYTWSVLVIY